MGTSASSSGPGKGVPFDPPWLDDIVLPCDEKPVADLNIKPTKESSPTFDELEQQIAPSRRYAGARRSLGDFIKTGSTHSLARAIGYYSRNGMGGAKRVAKRMSLSTRSAAALAQYLHRIQEGTNEDINAWVSGLIERDASTSEIIDELVLRIAAQGGSEDESQSRASLEQALTELCRENAEINLLKLNDDDIWRLIESFLGVEAYKRICFDIGQRYEDSSIPIQTKMQRIIEMQQYVEAEIFVQIEKIRKAISGINTDNLADVLQKAIENTFLVYEEAL